MSAMIDANSLPSSKEITKEAGMGISKPHDNDVLFGRGGNINVHPGNEVFRGIVSGHKQTYIAARGVKEKRLIVDGVLAAIANLNPPGRFLDKDSSTGLWHAVEYEKARSKASQALRENTSFIKPNIHIENVALRAELKKHKEQEARRIAARCYVPHHGYEASYKEYHYENTIPFIQGKENINSRHIAEQCHAPHHGYQEHDENLMSCINRVNSSDLHAGNGLSYNTPPYYNTVIECQFKNSRIPTECNGNNYNHNLAHSESKEYGIERTKDLNELSFSLRPVKINHDYETVETTKNGWYSTPTNMDPSLNSNCIVSHSNGGEKKALMPLFIDDKVRKSKMKQNRCRENEMKTLTSSSLGCHAKEEMFNRERLASLQSITIDDSGTIYDGQSLVHVFDGDGMRNRELSDISMLSDL